MSTDYDRADALWERMIRAKLDVTVHLTLDWVKAPDAEYVSEVARFYVAVRRAPRQRIVRAKGGTRAEALERAAGHPLIAPILRGEVRVGE